MTDATQNNHTRLLIAIALASCVPRVGVAVSALDGVDDRRPLQAALDAGGDVAIPAGHYYVTQAPSRYWCLDVPAGARLHGVGEVTIEQLPGMAGSVRLAHVAADDVTIEHLVLDGNAAAQDTDKAKQDEHRAGIFAGPAARLRVVDVTAQHFTGDGFVLWQGVTGATLERVVAVDNGRNGITLDANVTGTLIHGSLIRLNRAQQIDHEPGGTAVVSGTTIVGNVIEGGSDYAVTLAGSSPTTPSSGLRLIDNVITGGVEVIWARDVTIANNTITAAGKSAITVMRTTADVTIERNGLVYQSGPAWGAAVLVQGTTAEGSSRLRFAGNAVTVQCAACLGVRVEGAGDVAIVGNTLTGAGKDAPGMSGVALRATIPTRDFARAVVDGNTIMGFGDRGIGVAGNGAAALRELELLHNTFVAGGSQLHGAVLDDGTGALRSLVTYENTIGTGVLTGITRIPEACAVTGAP